MCLKGGILVCEFQSEREKRFSYLRCVQMTLDLGLVKNFSSGKIYFSRDQVRNGSLRSVTVFKGAYLEIFGFIKNGHYPFYGNSNKKDVNLADFNYP